MYPGYLELYRSGKLKEIAVELFGSLSSCAICPRKCRVNRFEDKRGYCKTGLKAKFFSFMAHQGEEPPISGSRGSGAIFFACCNMSCVYCQNYEFSQLGQGKEVSDLELAEIMLKLQAMGCHNINFVTPTHVLPQILNALLIAIPGGLNIPIVYNTGGYELPEIIARIEGVVDIYLPDMRYSDADMAKDYSNAPDYPEYNQASVKEMHRQVGIANINKEGIMETGVIIRHLVLPNNISGTDKIMRFIGLELSSDTYVSLMSQFLPYYKASEFKDLNRRLSFKEYGLAKQALEEFGIGNGWIQESFGAERFAGVNIKPVC